MIVKKVPARAASRDDAFARSAHARQLVDYLELPEKDNPYKDYLIAYMTGEKSPDGSTERLLHIGSRGFVSETLQGQRLEMMATAQAAVRSNNPIDHWILSLREGDFPTAEQVDQAVEIFLDHMGVGDRQCIYALHGDTHNRHIHLALNRYDPMADRVIEINDGFNREASHQAVALIVDHFGWQAEADARYVIENGRPVLSESAQRRISEGEQSIKPAAAAFEGRTGYKSLQRIAQETALPIIKQARSWPELHSRLAQVGLVYEKKGSGAVVRRGEEAVKVSTVHRKITIAALAARLGPFVDREAALPITERPVEADRFPQAFRADEYRAEREAWREWQEAQKAARNQARAARQGQKPRPNLERARKLAARRAVDRRGRPPKPAKDLEDFYYANHEVWFAQRWRFRSVRCDPFLLEGKERAGRAIPTQIDGYLAFPCTEGIRYARPNEGTAFIDRGNRVEVTSHRDDAALAALRLAVDKFGTVRVSGSDEFCQRVFALAEQHGLADAIANPEFAAERTVHIARRAGPTPMALPAGMQALPERRVRSHGPEKQPEQPISPKGKTGPER